MEFDTTPNQLCMKAATEDNSAKLTDLMQSDFFFFSELPHSCVIVKSSSRKAAVMSVEVVGKNRTAVFCGNLHFGFAMRR